MRVLLHISFLLIQAQMIFAQGQSFRATLDREAILIGEQVNLKLELRTQASDTASLPFIQDTLIKEVEVVSASKIDTAFEGNDLSQRVLSQNLTLTSFDSGYFAIAPLQAIVNGNVVESNPFLISVQTVPVDTAKGIYDIRGVSEVPFSLTEWLKEYWYWIVGPLVFLAILTYLMLMWSKKPVQQIIEKPKPKRPLHEIALERLDELEQKKLWQASKTKEYYSELTDILREYIELRFSIPALEQTTDEIMTSMKRLPEFTPEQLDKTKRLLFLADLVKFAKESPVGSENDMHLQNARDFVIGTKMITEEKPASKEEADV
ncbi:MAG: hypothetical protein R2813_11560 [Flavobacteriales bacterium]